jgi:hypothetical protein
VIRIPEIFITSPPNLRMFRIAPSPQSSRSKSLLSSLTPMHAKPLSTLGEAAEVPKKVIFNG